MESKKISFGFTKTRRATDTRLAAPLQPRAEDERRDYIECVEGKSIKVVGGEAVEEVKPLVIPLKPNTLATADRLQQIAAEVESALQAEPDSQDKNGDGVVETPVLGQETLEQQAARELLQEARRERTVETSALTVPMPALPPLLGEKESTLEDYESIPVGDFGMAMLRGMGWMPGKQSQYAQPALRPKGLGLGADKLVKAGKADKGRGGAQAEGEEELKLQKGSLVRVLAGKHAGMYGKVISLDEESGRALLEPAVKGPSVSVSEHTLQPVTRRHYQENSRVINSEKFEEYKLKEKLANEKKEKSNPSKKTHEQSSGKSKDSRKLSDNNNGRNEGNSLSQTKSNRRDSSSDDDGKGFNKDKRPSDRNSRRYSLSSEDNRDNQKSRSKGNSNRVRKPSLASEDEKPEKSSLIRYEHNAHRSKSNSVDRRGASDFSRNRTSRNRSSSAEDKARRRPRAQSSSSEEGRTEKKSHTDKSNRARKTRRSSSSEDSRTRRKHKSKNSHKASSGSESLNSLSSDDQKHSKKSKKNKTRSGTPVGKRDIDKKRKGKKKRRDRDRSPNYRKHKR